MWWGLRRRPSVRFVLISVFVVLSSGFTMLADPVAGLEAHEPIVINGNADFTAANGIRTGSGTAADPYVISDWEIAPLTNRSGIVVTNTDAHFVVRNITVHSCGSSGSGIMLTRVMNARIESSTAWGCENGVLLQNVSAAEISGGDFTGRGWTILEPPRAAVLAMGARNVTIRGNTIRAENRGGQDIGVWLHESEDMRVEENRFLNSSIDLSSIRNSSLVRNQLLNSTILLIAWESAAGIESVLVADNEIHGGYVWANATTTDVIIARNRLDGEGSINVRGYEQPTLALRPMIVDNHASRISLGLSTDAIVSGNTFVGDGNPSLWVMDSYGPRILNNTFDSNTSGLLLMDSVGATISGNTFSKNGVELATGLAASAVSFYASHTITPDNTVNGKPVIYHKNCNGLDLNGAVVGQLLVANCTNIRLTYLEISDVDMAIQLAFVRNATLASNSVSNTRGHGIRVQEGTNLTVAGNRIVGAGSNGISLLDIRNANISRNELQSNSCGICVSFAEGVTLHSNNASMNWVGLHVYGGQNIAFLGNAASGNSATGIGASYSTNVTLEANSAWENYGGISVQHSEDVIVRNTIALANEVGIDIHGSLRGLVTENFVASNAMRGISLRAAAVFGFYPVKEFVVYRNDIRDNGIQAIDQDPDGTNAWNESYPLGGNFWSDYGGVDLCSGPAQDTCPDPDGIGDSPFVIDDNTRDAYPLTSSPLEPNTPPVARFRVVTPAISVGSQFTVDALLSSDLQDASASLVIRWDWENDGTWDTDWNTTKVASYAYDATGTRSIGLEVRDTGGLTDIAIENVLVVEPLSVTAQGRPTRGTVPLAVVFSAVASGGLAPYSFLWTFGDGTTSTEQRPTHVYGIAGQYQVTVTVSSATGTATESLTVVVEASWWYGTGSSLPPWVLYVAAAATAVALAGLFLWRRRKRPS